MKSRSKLIFFTIIIIFAWLNSTPAAENKTSESPVINEDSIVVMPFFKGRYGSTIHETMDSPFSRLAYDSENVSEEADSILTRIVHEEMKLKYGNNIAPFLDGIIVYDSIKKESTDTIRNLAKKTGEILKVKRVMVGYVWRYQRRVGSSIAVSRPASVGFTLCLVDAATGETLWNAVVEERQKSLSEDIMKIRGFFKRGAKWLTVDELARFSLKEMLDKRPPGLN